MSLFDEEIDRRFTNSTKWSKYADQPILPLWIADTDFRSPKCVTDALQKRIEHGVFGYGIVPKSLIDIIVQRMAEKYQWSIQPEWLIFLPGLVCGLNLSVRAFTQPNESVIMPHPIYPPFMTATHLAQRARRHLPLKAVNQRWTFDYAALTPQRQGNEKLLMLCNPLNPGGTVFSRDELSAQLKFAQQHQLIVCSDEIHCDLILSPTLSHIPFGSLNEEAAQCSITLMAPSKTFNIAGLGAAFAIIPNPQLRQQFMQTREGIVPPVDILALVAAQAAYKGGQSWLDEQLDYLRHNRDILVKRINQIPGLSIFPIEGTYLAWIDASGLPIDNPHQFFEKAGVGLTSGADFGQPQFVRLNFGCPQKRLIEALDRMEQACMTLFHG